MTSSPTAGAIRKHLLNEAMDARAHNMDQARLLWNPTPEADSLLEYLHEIRDAVPVEVMSKMLTLIRQLVESNQVEGEHERRLAGFADQMAQYARGVETGAWS